MNTEISAQWLQGLPPTLESDLFWKKYSTLEVGLVGRSTLIALKLFAAVDTGLNSIHFQDLVALKPTASELSLASDWVIQQDAAEVFPNLVMAVIHEVLSALA